jgi:hydroxymethylpyrimidine/phosphomethylpyrimidine kinase
MEQSKRRPPARRPDVTRPVVLAIAGSDPTGGAGIQADLKAIEAGGAWAATAITAITAQTSRLVHRWEALSPDLVVAQIEAVLADREVRVAKTGMLARARIATRVAERLALSGLTVVVDPVLCASGGEALGEEGLAEALGAALLPIAALVTPNADEARRLTGVEVRDAGTAERAGRRLLALGARAALVKGGHFERDRATDVLVTPGGVERIEGDWIETVHGHGTGCTYASAIAARLARGMSLVEAVREAKRFTADALRHARPGGAGGGPVDALFGLAVEERA